MPRHLILHGHFYQPPRDNPWLGQAEQVEIAQARAAKGYNQVVDLQCYTPNSLAHAPGDDGITLVNNYRHMSFNIGPTLMQWLKDANFGTYQRIIEGDLLSQDSCDGRGNALAQAYNHAILPLASRRDKLTQIHWGKTAFEQTFGRPAQGMWLAEAAIDHETVECLAECGIAFTVAHPRGARRVRPLKEELWREPSREGVDVTRPYLVRTQQGDVAIFFMDAFYYEHIGGMLKDVEVFLDSLDARYPENGRDQAIVICTDGELYGHWEPHGERFLAYLFSTACRKRGIRVTNFAKFLAEHPPRDEVELSQASSWSCPHGVERWRSNCGCSDEHPGRQEYRAPLRKAINALSDTLYAIYEDQTRAYLIDPLATRLHLPDLSPGDEISEMAFLDAHLKPEVKPVGLGIRQGILDLLASQRYAQMMLTSCGWFFWDISRPEPLKNLQYAARAIEHLKSIALIEKVERDFLDMLRHASSNALPGLTARDLYIRESRYTAMKYPSEIETVFFDTGVLLKLPANVTGAMAEKMQWELSSLMSKGSSNLVLDFSQVDAIDNYGVSSIMAAIPASRNRGGKITIYRATENIAEMFRMARLADHVVFATDRATFF
jgi:anti-anti-sigma regulatory factor